MGQHRRAVFFFGAFNLIMVNFQRASRSTRLLIPMAAAHLLLGAPTPLRSHHLLLRLHSLSTAVEADGCSEWGRQIRDI